MNKNKDVYVGENYRHAFNVLRHPHRDIMRRNAEAAAAAGFRRFRFSDETDMTWEVSQFYTKPVEKPVEKTLTEKVAAYLADPTRTQREQVNRRLTELGFWKALTDEVRTEILHALLKDNTYCEEGKQRFADAVGIERGLYPGHPDLTKAVEVEMLISEGGNAEGWLTTVNEALDKFRADRTYGSPRARFRMKESK